MYIAPWILVALAVFIVLQSFAVALLLSQLLRRQWNEPFPLPIRDDKGWTHQYAASATMNILRSKSGIEMEVVAKKLSGNGFLRMGVSLSKSEALKVSNKLKVTAELEP